ncbi:MAG TPA: hypothetical protein VMZ31_02990 [Phycisphaerae bacterium]|nr:hypothetical protein [Phycisphaerae bacterium]
MDALMQSLMAKIKTLSETIWEHRAKEPAIAEWLSNFAPLDQSGLDEQAHALFVLSNFMYFGSRQIRELLKALYRDLYKYPIVESIRRANDHTLDSQLISRQFREELQRTRFLGVGNPAESGCHLLYYFRQENDLPTKLFIHAHQIFTRHGEQQILDLRDADVSRYIFIDDFCGSGKQGTKYSRDLVEEVKRLNPRAVVAYYVLLATVQGITRIKNDTAFDEARAIYELDISFKCFSAESRYFRPQVPGIDRGVCEEMCRRYGERMVPAPDVLGFEDSQLLVGFHHNTPDNTLPIIWCDGTADAPWSPIFRRYPKLGW